MTIFQADSPEAAAMLIMRRGKNQDQIGHRENSQINELGINIAENIEKNGKGIFSCEHSTIKLGTTQSSVNSCAM